MAWVRRAGVLLLVIVLALAAGASADAKKRHKKKSSWRSTVTLSQPSSTQFAGTVGSKLKECRKDRVVTLYYTDPNTGQTQPLSVQRTDGSGRYEMDLTKPAFTGGYQVTVDQQKVRAMDAKQTCRATQSALVDVTGVPLAPS